MESEGLGGKREREDTLKLFKWLGRRHSDWGYNGTKERKRQTTCEMHFGDCIPGLLMRLRERMSQGVCCLEPL